MMLASSSTTRRPRPPAQLRHASTTIRKGKSEASPPPPYASAFLPTTNETLLGSPVHATMQIVRDLSQETVDDSVSSGNLEEHLDWLNERSRDELSRLLLTADSLIKKREDELDHSSTICKNLYDENRLLQNQHSALLARIPPTPSRSPCSTPLGHTPTNSMSSSSAIPQGKLRIRRMSVSPEDISELADQNAELLSKLQELEEEASNTDNSSRQKLKKLESEIALLRDELEQTHAKNAELEERTKDGVPVDAGKIAEEILKRKDERESRLQALKAHSPTHHIYRGDMEVRDFAPGGPLSNPTLSPPRTPTRPRTSSISEPQLSVISQLLKKIQELEDTNAHIIEQQKETSTKLQAVQRDTENMAKVYECLNDMGDVHLELVGESPPAKDSYFSTENTIRFRSFRRSLQRIPTTNSADEMDLINSNLSARKPRKSVFDLFNPEENSASSPQTDKPKLRVPFPLHHRSSSMDSVSDLNGSPMTSPALSTLSFTPSTIHSHATTSTIPEISPLGSRTTLQTELGSDYGDGSALNAVNYHLRTSSLYDLSSWQMSAPPTPSPMPARKLLNDEDIKCQRDDPKTPRSMMTSASALQLTLEPPTPPQDDDPGSSSKQSLRYRKMSQTVRSRTRNWVDGRFNNTWLGTPSGNGYTRSLSASPSRGMPHTPTPFVRRQLSSAFDRVVDVITNVRNASTESEDADVNPQIPVSIHTAEKAGPQDSQKETKFASFLLEVWLWLQFAIIIMLFLWAMAKKGPKSILADSTQRTCVKHR